MRMIHIVDKKVNTDDYINIESISSIMIRQNDNKNCVEIDTGSIRLPIALNVENSKEIVENFIKSINTVKNDIIEYEVINKEAE